MASLYLIKRGPMPADYPLARAALASRDSVRTTEADRDEKSGTTR